MSTKAKKSGISATSVKKGAKRAVRKTESALVSVADRIPAGRRKQARKSSKRPQSRTERFLKSTPVRVLVGASAMAFVVAKLKHLV